MKQEEYLKALEAGTASSGYSCEKAFMQPERSCTPLQQLKEEISMMFDKLQQMQLSAKEVPFYMDAGLALKRSGHYVESSRLYGSWTIENSTLSPKYILGWFKTPASGGAVLDALRLGNFAISKLPECYATDVLGYYLIGFKQISDMDDKETLLKVLSAISGNPNYYIEPYEIDIYQK